MFRHLLSFIWNRKKKNALLIVELAFAFIILFGVYTFIYFNIERYNSPLGFDTKDRLVVMLGSNTEIDSLDAAKLDENLRGAIRSLPEVKSTSMSFDVVPFSGSNWMSSFEDRGVQANPNMIFADEDFAEVMNLKVIEGHWFKKENRYNKYPALVITKQLKDRVWPDTAVIGHVIQWNGIEQQIVGVVDHYKYQGEFRAEHDIIFSDLIEPHKYELALTVLLKEGVSNGVEPKIDEILKRETNGYWEFSIRNLDNIRLIASRSKWIPIMVFICISLFLILNVALGLFGVLLYNIKKRKSEIGLRRALGATSASVFRQLIGEMLIITTFGLIIGFFFAIQAPLLSIFPVAIETYVTATLLAATTVILLVLICTIYPGTQAILIRPATALHDE